MTELDHIETEGRNLADLIQLALTANLDPTESAKSMDEPVLYGIHLRLRGELAECLALLERHQTRVEVLRARDAMATIR